MKINKNEKPLDKMFFEIIVDTSVMKAYKLGTANMAKFLVDVLEKMEIGGFKTIGTNDLRDIINKTMLDDKETHAYFERL
ncbi:hypothetical protein NV379_02030 [Paenibacillus sp. N1-5-1-14]|uniref:hypothetical protein n=1 Tax=Paenibacillus radicibacter TaxID=2972488 RepID=UPI0021598D0F|nr:hypothetical protein [Paenibacillus radicibacter]MCR8641424.1 hypothetical protein [Paenibacillus radicibacter]